MPQSRMSQICLSDTPYYHCVSRCVRRAFLCGEDKITGKSYEHRREWVEKKLHFLVQVFAIDVCAYAVMHNHTHIVLHVNLKKADMMDVKDVLFRWHRLFKGTLLTRKFTNDEILTENELTTVMETASIYKERLSSISWFMRVLNEGIAREANKEDDCSGRFWEGRFKSQALLDEAALIACMAYVDLNPVRAGVASTPELSDFTSIKLRVQKALKGQQPKSLMPLIEKGKCTRSTAINFELEDYFKLVDFTGRCIRGGSRGVINTALPDILVRLNINRDNWFVVSKQFEKTFRGAVGRESSLTTKYGSQGKRRSNISSCRMLLG